MLRNSLAHVARGADAVMFFQWRQSKAGAEKFHSSMLPHAGRDTDVWRSTVTLGETLKKIAPVVGSRVRSRAALLFDYEAWWASELDSHPTQQLRYTDEVLSTYTALWNRGVSTDVVHPSADLSGYDLVVVPTLYLVSDEDAASVAAAAERGATVLVTYFSGIVDINDHVRLGGYPGAFRTLLGVSTEEFYTLQEGETVGLSGSGDALSGTFSADLWTEKTHLVGATAVATFDEGPLAGLPAVTRADVGTSGGSAWYVGARLDPSGIAAVVDAALADAGLTGEADVPAGVEVVRRHAADGTSYLFVLNHTGAAVTVKTTGTELHRRGRGRRRAAPSTRRGSPSSRKARSRARGASASARLPRRHRTTLSPGARSSQGDRRQRDVGGGCRQLDAGDLLGRQRRAGAQARGRRGGAPGPGGRREALPGLGHQGQLVGDAVDEPTLRVAAGPLEPRAPCGRLQRQGRLDAAAVDGLQPDLVRERLDRRGLVLAGDLGHEGPRRESAEHESGRGRDEEHPPTGLGGAGPPGEQGDRRGGLTVGRGRGLAAGPVTARASRGSTSPSTPGIPAALRQPGCTARTS